MSIPAESTLEDSSRPLQFGSRDFRGNWEQLLTSMKTSQEVPGPEKTLKDETCGMTGACDGEMRSPGSRGYEFKSKLNYTVGKSLPSPSTIERSPSANSQSALRTEKIAPNSDDFKATEKIRIAQEHRAPKHGEGKGSDRLTPVRRQATTPLASAQRAGELIPATHIVTSSIPMQAQDSVKILPSSSGSKSDARSESSDAIAPDRDRNEVPGLPSSDASPDRGSQMGGKGEETDTLTPPLFPAIPIPTSDGDIDRIAAAPRSTTGLNASHTELSSPNENRMSSIRSFSAPSHESAGRDANITQPVQWNYRSTLNSERTATTSATTGTRGEQTAKLRA